MATRQYIGARYVPQLFSNPDGSNNWIQDIPYESLTIVTYLNNSYTSKLPVPASNIPPNEDKEHWVLTGNYNAQIEEYRQEVEEISKKINYVTPEMFGAIGDGIADDTNAIQQAVSGGNKLVYFSKKYKITSTINIEDRTTLLGNNAAAIVTTEDITLINALNCSFINIKDLVLNKPCGNNYHIKCSGYKHTIDHCELNGVLTNVNEYVSGIHFIKPTQVGLDGFEFTVKNSIITVGQIVVEGGTDGYIVDNVVWSSSITETPNCYAIEVKDNSYDIKGNQIVPGKLGGLLLQGNPGACLFNVIDNYFDGSHDTVLSGTLLVIKNCDQNVLISQNKFYNGYKNAITVDNSPYSLITSNTFINNNRSGLAEAHDIIFINNIYGERAIVSNNQFANYHQINSVLHIHEKSIITFTNNQIIGDGYGYELGYLLAEYVNAFNNVQNNILYKDQIGVVKQLPDGVYGDVINNEVIENNLAVYKVYVNGVDRTNEFSTELRYGSYFVIKGDDSYLGAVIRIIYGFSC